MIKIAVRELAYYVYQSGNLTNSNSFNQKAVDGKYLHQIRQSEYDGENEKEYYVSKEIEYKNKQYEIHGFIDGLLESKKRLVLEEIKTTDNYVYDENFKEKPEHLAQLKIYGYLMLIDSEFKEANLQLLYIERKKYNRRTFKYNYSYEELKDFFFATLDKYIKYLELVNSIEFDRINSLKNLNFPFNNLRTGQSEMLNFLADNLVTSKFNFILAPTGIGKTMASLYSSLNKTKELNAKLFYLTAKTSGKEIAKNSLKLLQKEGYLGKVLILTAKRKICFKNTNYCDADNCEFAKNFFDKLKAATFDILEKENIIDDNTINKYASLYQICPFEFSLHLSLFMGVIICDYNYVFDPKVKLVRFFEENNYKNLILVDEAHNLVSRSQNMYSSELSIISLLTLKKYLIKEEHISKKITKIINYLHKTYDLLLNKDNYYLQKDNDLELEGYLLDICQDIEILLENEHELTNREQVVEKYLDLRDYLRISNLYSSSHIFLIKNIDNNLIIYLNCLDASYFLSQIIKESTKGVTYFSATLYPIDYYKSLLINNNEYEYLALESPFKQDNLGLFISPVSTRYKDREMTINYIYDLVNKVIYTKPGKYIIFFPSYQYLNLFLTNLDLKDYKIVIQTEGMTENNQREILEKFNSEDNLLGLFVLGGVFSEGIDFIGDKLHGVIVVGVGFPQVNLENEILKDYFNNNQMNGFDYAYTYPGFNKVVQAAGRVIRTDTDKGIVLLIDDRYLTQRYLSIFPKHWSHYEVIRSSKYLEDKLDRFWFK